jgi:poly-gamma-glutamate capsule biosynthesis protein CapA/YwtB (metallophosphatase superfamily)
MPTVTDESINLLRIKSAVFWGITRRRVVIVYRHFGTTYRSHPHGSRVQVGKKTYNVDSGKYGGVAVRRCDNSQ